MVADQAVLTSWRSVVSTLEDDARVSARLMGYVYLAQPQGQIGNTLLLAVPNETTRETLQSAQVAEALTDALTAVFREEILLAISIDANLQPPRTPEPEARRSALAGEPVSAEPTPDPDSRPGRRAVAAELPGFERRQEDPAPEAPAASSSAHTSGASAGTVLNGEPLRPGQRVQPQRKNRRRK